MNTPTTADFVSVRIITGDVERLTRFFEHVTGVSAERPAPVFAELRTATGTIAIGAPATVSMLGANAPVPGPNGSTLIELRVTDVDQTWDRLCRSSPAVVAEVVLEPADMPWGNRSMILRDPDGGLLNLFTPITREARAKYGLD
ncbi:MAG TPA: VOC family protein [Microlunatus sp.]